MREFTMKQSRLVNTAITLVSLAIGLAGAELGVRLLDIRPRPMEPLPVLMYRLSDNPILQYEFHPGYVQSADHQKNI